MGIDNPPPQAAFSYVIEDSAAFQVAFYDAAGVVAVGKLVVRH